MPMTMTMVLSNNKGTERLLKRIKEHQRVGSFVRLARRGYTKYSNYRTRVALFFTYLTLHVYLIVSSSRITQMSPFIC